MLLVYDDFELCGVVASYTTLAWRERYNTISDFELSMPFDAETLALLKYGRVLYKRDTQKAMFVESVNIYKDVYNVERVIIKGRGVEAILERRIATLEGEKLISVAIKEVLEQNFTKATNTKRNIHNFFIGNIVNVNDKNVILELKNRQVIDIIEAICQENALGYKVDYNITQKRYDFVLYAGADNKHVILDETFGNVLEQDYIKSVAGEKTTCIVDVDKVITIVNDDVAGLMRKEIYVSTSKVDAAEHGKRVLLENGPLVSVDSVIDINNLSFKYLEDYHVGDVVCVKNSKWGVVMYQNIDEIESYYDKDGLHLSVIFKNYKKG